MKHTIFITGGAGYVGSILVDQFSKCDDVEKIIVLDKDNLPKFQDKASDKIVFIKSNMIDSDWQEQVAKYNPDIVIHTAWQIRTLYRNEKKQWVWNILGSDKVFDFVFKNKSVKKFIHFSTIASYGAYSQNTTDHFFTEEETFRKSDYLYAIEKAESEKRLFAKYCQNKKIRSDLQVFVLRPASITGPMGRKKIRFGLQSALSGNVGKNLLYRFVARILSVAPMTKNWCRQFIHEDDLYDIVRLLSFSKLNTTYEVFNVCPPGDVVLAKDMAQAVGKKMIILPPWFIRIAFFIMWHLSLGKIPTSQGGWKSYSYPIAVDGSKITKLLGYKYKYGPKESFSKIQGRYK